MRGGGCCGRLVVRVVESGGARCGVHGRPPGREVVRELGRVERVVVHLAVEAELGESAEVVRVVCAATEWTAAKVRVGG